MGRQIERSEILKRLNNIPDFVSEYNIDVNTINGICKKATFYHKTCNNNFSMMIKSFIGNPSNPGHRCPICAADKRIISNTKTVGKKSIKSNDDRDIDSYIGRINSENDYEFIKLSSENFGCHSKAEIRHNKCGKTFIKRFSDFIYNKQYCPYCVKNTRIKPYEIAYAKFEEHGYTLLDNEYQGTHYNHNIKCIYCGEISKRSYNSIVNLNGKCSCQKEMYKGEELIKKYLLEKNIPFLRNITLEGLELTSNLRVDFYIESINTIIEYDGIQHFKQRDFFSDSLEIIRNRDITKNKYALDNSINIIRISYKEISYSEIVKILDYTLFDKLIDGKPYDGKLSRTVWVGGKSSYEDYVKYNS